MSKSAPSPPKERKAAPARHVYTWEEYEGTKSRAASAMDRCEFLQNTRNKFTEFRAQEASKQGNILRSRSNPILNFSATLAKSTTGANRLLENQVKTAGQVNTRKKRLEAMNKYVIDAEARRGKEHGEAARSASAGTHPVERPYPLYEELFNLTHDGSKRRASPELSISIPLGYEMPPDALRHGTMRSKGGSKQLSKTA